MIVRELMVVMDVMDAGCPHSMPETVSLAGTGVSCGRGWWKRGSTELSSP